jgi:PadR family transcriptional regulator PadR
LHNKIHGDTLLAVSAPPADAHESRRGIERELKRGALELILLSLLAPAEAYGYEIGAKLEARSEGRITISDGTLYPVLYRLEQGGFVAVRWETPVRGVPRKYYRLTPDGRLELDRLTREWTRFADAMARLLTSNGPSA